MVFAQNFTLCYIILGIKYCIIFPTVVVHNSHVSIANLNHKRGTWISSLDATVACNICFMIVETCLLVPELDRLMKDWVLNTDCSSHNY